MYSRLFSSIVHSSVWCEDAETKVVWVTMLALADREGFVFAALPGLAKAAAVSLEATQRALAKFEAPDPHSSDLSRKPENEGRRIEKVDGGWRILNYAHYRDLPDADVRRDQVRKAVERHRERKAKGSRKRNPVKSPVITGNQQQSPVIPSDATTTAESDADPSNTQDLPPAGAGSPPAASGSSRRSPQEFTEAEQAFVRSFREDYRDNVDDAYQFPAQIPTSELRAARAFLRDKDWPPERIQRLKEAVMTDLIEDPAPGSTWRGWATQIRSVAKLREKRNDLEAKLVRGR